MLTGYEQRLIVRYLANFASCLHHRDREAKSVVSGIPGAVQYRQVSKSGLRVDRANGCKAGSPPLCSEAAARGVGSLNRARPDLWEPRRVTAPGHSARRP